MSDSQQKGMFAFTGLTKEQVLALREKHHVYLLSNGRISLSGCKCLLLPVSHILMKY